MVKSMGKVTPAGNGIGLRSIGTGLIVNPPRHAPPLSTAVATAIDYVGANVPSVRLRNLGLAAAKSPHCLSRLFQRETGLALKGFINRVRRGRATRCVPSVEDLRQVLRIPSR